MEVTEQAREHAAVFAEDICHDWDCASNWPTPRVSCISITWRLVSHAQLNENSEGGTQQPVFTTLARGQSWLCSVNSFLGVIGTSEFEEGSLYNESLSREHLVLLPAL